MTSKDGMEGSAVAPLTVKYGETAADPVDYNDPTTFPTLEGRSFTGWDITFPIEAMPAHDVTATAQWTNNIYKITYIVHGEVYDTVEYAYDAPIATHDAPLFEGNTFRAWFCEKKPDVLISGKMPAMDLEFRAVWDVNDYVFTFKPENGDEDFSTNVTYSTELAEPETDPVREGYTFAGWTNLLDEVIVFPYRMPARDVTVWAKWVHDIGTSEEPVVVADPSDITPEMEEKLVYLEFAPTNDVGGITIPANVKELTLDLSELESNTITGAEGEVAISIPATAEKVVIKVDEGSTKSIFGGDGADGTAEATDGTAGAAAIDFYSETGVKFTGTLTIGAGVTVKGGKGGDAWRDGAGMPANTKRGGAGAYAISGVDASATITIETGATVLGGNGGDGAIAGAATAQAIDGVAGGTPGANGEDYVYVLSFDANGGDAKSNVEHVYLTALIDAEKADATREGFTFTGWTVGGETATIPATMPNEDVEFVATWSRNSYKVTFDANGGVGGSEATLEFDAEIVAPADPTRNGNNVGWTFGGWSGYTSGMKVPASDVTFDAIWTPVESSTEEPFVLPSLDNLDDLPQDINLKIVLEENIEGEALEIPETVASLELWMNGKTIEGGVNIKQHRATNVVIHVQGGTLEKGVSLPEIAGEATIFLENGNVNGEIDENGDGQSAVIVNGNSKLTITGPGRVEGGTLGIGESCDGGAAILVADHVGNLELTISGGANVVGGRGGDVSDGTTGGSGGHALEVTGTGTTVELTVEGDSILKGGKGGYATTAEGRGGLGGDAIKCDVASEFVTVLVKDQALVAGGDGGNAATYELAGLGGFVYEGGTVVTTQDSKALDGSRGVHGDGKSEETAFTIYNGEQLQEHADHLYDDYEYDDMSWYWGFDWDNFDWDWDW